MLQYWFLIVETIGPWLGIYYLTGSRARTIPFEKGMVRTLKLAAIAALLVTLSLMVFPEICARL